MFTVSFILLVLAAIAFGTLIFTFRLYEYLIGCSEGPISMREVARPIQEGAAGFFKVQYSTIASIAAIFAVVIYFFGTGGAGGSAPVSPLFNAAAFLLGGTLSALSGVLTMYLAVRVNVRVAAAATRSYSEALKVCFRGGLFGGLLILSNCLVGFILLYWFAEMTGMAGGDITQVPVLFVGYAFGASFVALFAQLGGGIYTKAADVGADMVGKVDTGIPEDDPRNPATIADLVGDNVGDASGRSCDLFESISAELVGASILGGTLARTANLTPSSQAAYVLFPLCVHAVGLICSAIGGLAVRVRHHSSADEQRSLLRGDSQSDDYLEDPMTIMKRGFRVTMILAAISIWVLCWLLLRVGNVAPKAWWHYALCGMIGLAVSYLYVLITEYYTDTKFRPVRDIATASEYGHGTNVIRMLAVGLESSTLPAVIVSAAILGAYWLGATSGMPDRNSAGIFGTAVATMGMLSSAGIVLAMDVFGPVADNAGGIAEMSGADPEIRRITDRLDAAGNSTKAFTKGFAVGSAALAGYLLFSSFMEEMSAQLPEKMPFSSVDLAKPEVFVAGLLGAAVVFLFSSLAMTAVGHAAQGVVAEVRRQFREHPGIMAGTEKPEYERCVALVAAAALRQMILPGLLPVLAPIVIGMLFRFIGNMTGRPLLGLECAAGLLMVATIAGILMALFMNNAGGAADNAKKYIEDGHCGGKGSQAHKASVTGDTVGDPLKDTAGPSLHVLIKMLSTLTMVFGPAFVGRVNV
jgi:H(+)-translocating pyrophosphatase